MLRGSIKREHVHCIACLFWQAGLSFSIFVCSSLVLLFDQGFGGGVPVVVSLFWCELVVDGVGGVAANGKYHSLVKPAFSLDASLKGGNRFPLKYLRTRR